MYGAVAAPLQLTCSKPITKKSHCFSRSHVQFCNLSLNSKKDLAFMFTAQDTRKLSWCRKAFFFDGLLPDPLPNFQSPSELIMHFYQAINNKNLNRLDMYFSSDCIVEDSAFGEPFQGVKNSANYLRNLAKAMGENVKFVIDHVYDDNNSTAATTWHLEWSGNIIPFARGCSLFVFQKDNDGLHIRKAFFIVESPFKPGYIAVELLKLVSFSFDRFPTLAKWIIQNPYGIFQFVLKAYRTYVEPFILPLVFYYTGTWAYTVNVLKGLLELFFKIVAMFFAKR